MEKNHLNICRKLLQIAHQINNIFDGSQVDKTRGISTNIWRKKQYHKHISAECDYSTLK